MERPPQPKPWFLPGHGYFGNGTMSLFAYLVAPWHCLSSGGCSFVSQHTCKFVNLILGRAFNYCIFDLFFFCLVLQALLSAILKRMKGYIKLRIALGSLHAALPDATSEELRAYDDECAICRVCFCSIELFFHTPFQYLKLLYTF